MAKHRQFLNFFVPDDMMVQIDRCAEKSGLDRSKQARALIAYALGIDVRKPFIPAAQQHDLPYQK